MEDISVDPLRSLAARVDHVHFARNLHEELIVQSVNALEVLDRDALVARLASRLDVFVVLRWIGRQVDVHVRVPLVLFVGALVDDIFSRLDEILLFHVLPKDVPGCEQ